MKTYDLNKYKKLEVRRCVNCGTMIDEQIPDSFCSDECRYIALAIEIADAMDSNTLREAYIERLVNDYEQNPLHYHRDKKMMNGEDDNDEETETLNNLIADSTYKKSLNYYDNQSKMKI